MSAGLDTALWRFTYEAVVRTSRGPSLREAAEALGASEPEVLAAYQRLGEGHAILLDASGAGLWRIAPFSAVPTDFAVEAGGGPPLPHRAPGAPGIFAPLPPPGL